MGVDLDKNKNIEYPAGSMFWFRPEALKPLFDLDLQYSDFNEEIRSDGTLAHAVERIFIVSAENVGFNKKLILFKPELNILNKKPNKYIKIFYNLAVFIKRRIIFKLPYSWQLIFFKIIYRK